MRRQNRSCDQCRKAKRACDAPSLWDIQRNSERLQASADGTAAASTTSEDPLDKIDSRALRCSYCMRTRKQCTFHWVRSQLQTGLAGDASTQQQAGNNQRRVPDPARAKAKRHRAHPPNGATASPDQQALPHQSLDINTAALLDMLHGPQPPQDLGVWPPMEPGFGNFSTFPNAFDTMPVGGVFDGNGFDAAMPASMLGGLDANGHVPPMGCSPNSDIIVGVPSGQLGSVDDDNGENGWTVVQARAANDMAFQPSPAGSNSYESDTSSQSLTAMRHYSESIGRSYATSISPFSAANTMASATNKLLISDSLMRIYHDVLEHALSCWLSDETCPYKPRPNTIANPSSNNVSWLASHFENLNVMEPKRQDNRIYRRVVKLDQVAQASKLIQLTKSEDRAASKALRLAIMAFATQWAQGSKRERDRCHPTLVGTLENSRSEMDDMDEAFDRTLQRSLWAQAKRALQDCSDTECYRVVCADLIMGLAQKPMDEEDQAADAGWGSLGGTGLEAKSINGGEGSVASQISDLISQEGPPVFMERAARKMHALKFQYEARQTGVLDASNSALGLEKSAGTEDPLSDEDKATFGLVYWMTVMFDTVSSSMNGRPVVVTDEECHHDPTYPDHPEHEFYTLEYRPHEPRWWMDLFVREDKMDVIRWPCSYTKAQKGIFAAAPVKVILFRHVSYLQNTVRSNFRGEAVEKVILNAMMVYKHWNVTYGAFFRDLVNQYDTVPTHIQSWFVCVVAHFHCAALLLVDLIELIDEKGIGLEYSTQVRNSTKAVACLRADSAAILSDLARVSTCPRAGDVPGTNKSDLHFAVVEGSILTEPWTMILIRAFTKAAILHLTEVEASTKCGPAAFDTPIVSKLIKRSEDCTKALWCLGKKSDMARNIAGVLTGALGPFISAGMPMIVV